MRYTILFIASVMMCTLASAQVQTLADAKANNAVQLSGDELKQFLPGTKVVSHAPTGSTRRWENNASGNFVASTDGRSNIVSSNRTLPSTGTGSWKIDDKGMYCVAINWGMVSENWCRYIFKAGDKYYTFATLQDTGKSWEIELSK
jgi:hypothetical protein